MRIDHNMHNMINDHIMWNMRFDSS